MADRDYHNSRSPTRNPNVQRSTSVVGARLHFSYTGNETRTRSGSGQKLSVPKMSDTTGAHSSRLRKQSTFDYSNIGRNTVPTVEPPEASRRSVLLLPESSRISVRSPETSRRSTHVYTEPIIPKPSSLTENRIFQESRPAASNTVPEVPFLYREASSAPRYQPSKEVPLTTFSPRFPSSVLQHSTAAQNVMEAPPLSNQFSSSYGSWYSAYDPSKRVAPADTSQRIQVPPPPALAQHTAAEPVPVRRSPSPSTPFHSVYTTTASRPRRQTTTISHPETIYLPVHEYRPMSTLSNSAAREQAPTPAPKPQSLAVQMQDSRMRSPQRKHMTIGYTTSQYQDVRQAQELFREEVKKKEDEKRAELEAKKRAEDRARMEERQRKEEAAKLEALRRVEESARQTARLEAEKLALEAEMRATEPEEDADVVKFIENLEQRIEDSRKSKNLQGALVGRQYHAKSAENLTNAPTESDEKFERHVTNDQTSTKSAADHSEVRVFLDRLKKMKIDENQNRRKYAEYCYDPDEDDSEINSLNSVNSFLSTVPEEDPDTTSLENQSYTVDPQPVTLQPSVISYIHRMVDDILSSLDKNDIVNVIDTQKMSQLNDRELYSNDTNYNYRAISKTARQFFTPQSSPVDETTNEFYNDSL